MSLLEFRKNHYSQNGEDGVLEEILNRLGIQSDGSNWCVEVGAADGCYMSNTFNLVSTSKWNAIYVEADCERYDALRQTAKEFPTIRPILARVGQTNMGGTPLDELLAESELPQKYDILSIDIDSMDLAVWTHHVRFEPTIVVIEVNSLFAPGILKWHTCNSPGNSFSSTLNVAKAKGYSLVCHTGNMIFVKSEYAESLRLDAIDLAHPERLFLWNWIEKRRTHAELGMSSRRRMSKLGTLRSRI